MTPSRRSLLVLLCGSFSASTSFAQTIQPGSQIEVLASPPASVRIDGLTSNTLIRVFKERTGVVLASAVEIDAAVPGLYTDYVQLYPEAPGPVTTLPAGTVVDSYFIHMQDASATGVFQLTGTIVFPNDIVGMEVRKTRVDATDCAFGAVSTLYPGLGACFFQDVLFRGLDYDTDPDEVQLSADRRTLRVFMQTGAHQDDVRVFTASGTPTFLTYCFGTVGANCPCSNNGTPGNGCANSANGSGALLSAGGNASISADTTILHVAGMALSSPGLYFQGTTQLNGGAGTGFGDGLLCAGGAIIRLGVKNNVSGGSQYPEVGDQRVSVRGLVSSAGIRTYQCWYRDAGTFCTASTFNLTNGVQIAWSP